MREFKKKYAVNEVCANILATKFCILYPKIVSFILDPRIDIRFPTNNENPLSETLYKQTFRLSFITPEGRFFFDNGNITSWTE